MLRRLGPCGPLFLLGCLPSASPAPFLEGGRQDLLGLGAEATCKAQRDSLLLCHSLACPLTTPDRQPLVLARLRVSFPQLSGTLALSEAKPGLQCYLASPPSASFPRQQAPEA